MYVNTLDIRLTTTEGVDSDVFCLGHWGVSSLSTLYSPHQADPIRDVQSLIHPPFYAKMQRKKICLDKCVR